MNWDEHWCANRTFIGNKILKSKEKALEKMLKKIKCKTSIDIGCGKGQMLKALSKYTDAVGIDSSAGAYYHCRGQELPVEHRDLEEEVIERKKYDVVFSDGLIEHYLNFDTIIGQLCFLSNKYVIIAQTNHETFIVKLLLLLEHIYRKCNIYEYNFRIQDFIKEFKKCNFKLIEKQDVFYGGFCVLLFERNEL